MLYLRSCALAAIALGAILSAYAVPAVRAAETPTKPVIDLSVAGAAAKFSPTPGTGTQITASDSTDPAAPGVNFSLQPGPAGYPGVAIKPESPGAWDFGAFGHINAKVYNTGTVPLMIAMRVDNNGNWSDGPTNTESTYLKPGASGTINVIFGYTYGHKPGYPIKGDNIPQILLFTDKVKEPASFRVESILAGGIVGEKPPIDPSTIRVLPKDGVIVGPGVTVDPATQLSGFNTQPTVSGGSIQVPLPTSAEKQAIVIKPALGKWDLRTATQIRVRVKNTGTVPITPFAQARSGGNSTDLATASTPVAPGATTEIVTRFAPAVTWKGIPNSGDRTSWDGQPGTGTKFASDAVDSIKIGAAHDGAGSFSVDSVVADSPVAVLPDWLGKRPPVDGDWVMTFDDEFNGKAIDMTKWNIYGHNYWDSKTHFTKDNLLLDGKGVTLHFEKKRGPMNDDPKVMQDMTNPKVSETDYATGYLDSYGKWSQRYGYVEARVKLPTAPGLWPTFWMMPDRGTPGDPQWKRTDTANGGMEFDVMEHLDRWGDHRYNIAMHWDGYGKNHHQTGSTFNYTEHDRDGFITVGMLWSPGSAIYYCNGKEMLRWEDPRIGSTPEYFLIEITTGGWDNDRVDDSKLPADYMIDYVRAWQRKDLASPVDSAPNLNK